MAEVTTELVRHLGYNGVRLHQAVALCVKDIVKVAVVNPGTPSIYPQYMVTVAVACNQRLGLGLDHRYNLLLVSSPEGECPLWRYLLDEFGLDLSTWESWPTDMLDVRLFRAAMLKELKSLWAVEGAHIMRRGFMHALMRGAPI